LPKNEIFQSKDVASGNLCSSSKPFSQSHLGKYQIISFIPVIYVNIPSSFRNLMEENKKKFIYSCNLFSKSYGRKYPKI
jgi:hypothetical protein